MKSKTRMLVYGSAMGFVLGCILSTLYTAFVIILYIVNAYAYAFSNPNLYPNIMLIEVLTGIYAAFGYGYFFAVIVGIVPSSVLGGFTALIMSGIFALFGNRISRLTAMIIGGVISLGIVLAGCIAFWAPLTRMVWVTAFPVPVEKFFAIPYLWIGVPIIYIVAGSLGGYKLHQRYSKKS